MVSVWLWIPRLLTLNGWTNIYETWCVYHGTCAHLNGILHKSLPSVCIPICGSLIVARQRHGKNVTAAMNTHATIEELLNASFLCGPYRINERKWLVLPNKFLLYFRPKYSNGGKETCIKKYCYSTPPSGWNQVYSENVGNSNHE
jgi:hypothetical protein